MIQLAVPGSLAFQLQKRRISVEIDVCPVRSFTGLNSWGTQSGEDG